MTIDSFASAVGRFLLQTRSRYDLTLDQIAQAGRDYGATWSASSVRNIEKGQASLTLTNLLVLGLAIGRVTGKPVTLTDLLGDAEVFDLPSFAESGGPVSRAWVNGTLQGKALRAPRNDYELRTHVDDAEGFGTMLDDGLGDGDGVDWELEGQLSDQISEIQRKLANPTVSAEEKSAIRQKIEEAQVDAEWERMNDPDGYPQAASLSEVRAAKRLALSVTDLRTISRALWNNTLDKESALRAGAGASPQARGRVTRALMAEIREYLEGEKDG